MTKMVEMEHLFHLNYTELPVIGGPCYSNSHWGQPTKHSLDLHPTNNTGQTRNMKGTPHSRLLLKKSCKKLFLRSSYRFYYLASSKNIFQHVLLIFYKTKIKFVLKKLMFF